MKTQHEEMIADLGTLQDVVAGPLTQASMAVMSAILDGIEDNLALAKGAAQALGKLTSFSG